MHAQIGHTEERYTHLCLQDVGQVPPEGLLLQCDLVVQRYRYVVFWSLEALRAFACSNAAHHFAALRVCLLLSVPTYRLYRDKSQLLCS